MKQISVGVSILFHPIFLVVYMYMLYHLVNPYLFISSDHKASVLLFASIISLSVVFPLICIALMRMLGLIDTFSMSSKKERVGPLIATSLFYLWLYVNVKNNELVPELFSYYLLGAVIGLFFAFFINNFSKISLHAIGIGAFFAALVFLKFVFGYNDFLIGNINNKSYLVSTDLLIIAGVIVMGLVGTSRLALRTHSTDQIYGGYLVGICAHIIAYMIVF